MKFQSDTQSSTEKVFVDELTRLGGRYKNIVLMDANVSSVMGLQTFGKTFPERLVHFGNAGRAMVGAAEGFALRGKIPFLCSYANGAVGDGWRQIRNALCYGNVNVKIVGIHSGLLNSDEGAVNQSLEDMAIMRAIPNMKVVCPADVVQTRKALEAMVLDYGPTYLRLTHLSFVKLYDENYVFEFGKGHIYKQGTDVCIFACGAGVHTALEAAETLERKGVSVMVVNLASVDPIDVNLVVECAKAVQRVVTVEDHQIVGGLGSAVCEVLSEHYPVKVLRIGMDGFGESGRVDDLYRKYGLDGLGIAEKVGEWR